MPSIPRGAILTTDIKQVGDTVAGSDCHVQVVGLISKIPSRINPLPTIPRLNVRPEMNEHRASSNIAFARFSKASSSINDVLDDMAVFNEELAAQVRALEEEPVVARYNAVMITPDPLAVADDVVPWLEVTIPKGFTWTPFEAWIVCKTAPVGTPGGGPTDSGMIINVNYAVEYSALDTPVWISIFKAGLANQLILDESTNQRPGPLTNFD